MENSLGFDQVRKLFFYILTFLFAAYFFYNLTQEILLRNKHMTAA